jgi:UPF0473 protein athe_1150
MKGDKRIMDFENNDMEGLDEELDNIIILNDEDGNEVQFEFLDLIELDGEEYVVLLPVEDDEEEDGEVVILKVEDTDSEDEESYVSVDDQEILNKVFEIFKEKFKDEFNFIDED